MLKLNLTQKGFSLLELVLAVAIFSAAAISVGYLIIDAGKTTEVNSKKIGAILYAKEGIEAVRYIRDNTGFSDLVDHLGSNGLSFSGDAWSFSGVEDVSSDDVYTRTILIESVSSGIVKVTSTVSSESGTRPLTTTLVTEFADWHIQ